MDQIDAITAAARGAQPNTALADAKVSVVGLPVVLKDTRDYSDHDLRLIIAMTVCIVLLILIVLLRAIMAPLYLIGSVIVSYLAALGIGVIVFQFFTRSGNALEHSGIDLRYIGRGGRRLQYAAYF